MGSEAEASPLRVRPPESKGTGVSVFLLPGVNRRTGERGKRAPGEEAAPPLPPVASAALPAFWHGVSSEETPPATPGHLCSLGSSLLLLPSAGLSLKHFCWPVPLSSSGAPWLPWLRTGRGGRGPDGGGLSSQAQPLTSMARPLSQSFGLHTPSS